MTEELKQLREALRRVKYEAVSLANAQVIALEALTQRPAVQAGEVDERVAFEAWYREHHGNRDHFSKYDTGVFNGDYRDATVDGAWNVWQARASLPTPQHATPEPVGEVRCEGCGYMTHHREHMGCVRAAKQHTRPAPGVPEGWTDEQCLKFMCVALRHVEYKRGTKGPSCDDIRLGLKFALAVAQAKGQ